MTSNSAMVDPLWGYWVVSESTLTQLDYQVLTDLYQPLMGSHALSLYQLLWQHQEPLLSQRQPHAQLLNLLDLDAHAFYAARIKLEALALLQTFQNQDSWGHYLIYQLKRPLTGAEFMRDNILTTFLMEKIGQPDFKKLRKKYAPMQHNLHQAQEITKSFLDVFRLSNAVVDAPSETSAVLPKQVQYTTQQMAEFDWDLLAQRLAPLKVSAAQIQTARTDLFNLHTFYGLDEMELANLIAKTINLQTNQIDLPRLTKLVQKKYEKRSNMQARLSGEEPKQKPQENLQDLPQQQVQLVRSAQKLAPAEFLAAKKRQKGVAVFSSDVQVLRKLQARHILPDEVINILVNYVLDNSATLTNSFVEKIAGDWMQHQLTSAAAAVKYLQSFPQQKRVRKSKKSTKQEAATDWSQASSQEVSPTELAKLQQQLQKLNKKPQ
ncbi:DnaD domain protein [Bombilactobacillus folatiphilus]|uniref:DnaD domain protein n=1 Tax=Bombilactobacillus folatiphilus TaxID=2923362 RepID=A0ABY4PAI6_9LACO|nr:DnaD domain protein [Bombilactobacillus folatiphilus]UQS82649.1 DnaD domain protein [Bombilactobacillus folatiphilus]